MRIVVVGGSASNVGKTTLAVALIRESSASVKTAAMKVSVKEGPCETTVRCFDRANASGHRQDSERMLQAGACAVVWVTVSRPHVRDGLAAGLRKVRALRPEVVVIESTSAGIQMRRIDRSWFIGGTGEWKPWAHRHRDRADRVLTSDEAFALVAELEQGPAGA